MLGVTVSPT